MKKVRIMLSAIVVMAVVGGALAFNTKSPNFCLYQIDDDGACPSIDTYSTHGLVGAGNQTTLTSCPATTDPAICTRSFANLQKD